MTEKPRTLTEELNSVLRAHALDAPQPSRVIDAVLADAAGRPTPARRAKPRWLRRPDHLGNWAAAIVVVGLFAGVGGLILRTDPESNKSTSSTAAGASVPAYGAAAGSGASAGTEAGGDQATAPNRPPSAAQTAAASFPRVDNSTACPGGTTPLTTSVLALQDYDVDNYYCAETPSAPAGSVVQVRTPEIADARILATLVRPTQRLLVAYVSVVDDKIIVRAQALGRSPASAADPSATRSVVPAPSGPERLYGEPAEAGNGDVQELTFTVNDDATVIKPVSTEVIAKPCSKAAVTAAITTRSAASAVITVVNNSAYPCALTGYPDVQAATGGVTAAQTLTGPSGGVADSAFAPIVVIQPAGRATAILELPSTVGSCGSSALTVSLPGLGPVLTTAGNYGLCSLQVHPFVAGSTGSSP